MRKPKFKVGERVKLLDGSNIPNYSGYWGVGMVTYVGTESTINDVVYDQYTNVFRYYVNSNGYAWDERGLALVDTKPNWTVKITPVTSEQVEGTLYIGDDVSKVVAVESSDIEDACKLVTEKLFEKEEFQPGTTVKVIDSSSLAIPNGVLGVVVRKSIHTNDYLVDLKLPYPGCHHGGLNDLPEATGFYLAAHQLEKVDV